MKKIPLSNYIKAIIIVIFTVCLTIYVAKHYKSRIEYENSQNITMSFLTTIDSSNIEEYLFENPDTLMYISNSNDLTIKEYEQTLKSLILKKELQKNIVYFDIKNLDDNYVKELIQKYSLSEKKLDIIQPNLFVFKNRKISKILYENNKVLRASDIIYFVEDILEND